MHWLKTWKTSLSSSWSKNFKITFSQKVSCKSNWQAEKPANRQTDGVYSTGPDFFGPIFSMESS